jgi:hypothetical protein
MVENNQSRSHYILSSSEGPDQGKIWHLQGNLVVVSSDEVSASRLGDQHILLSPTIYSQRRFAVHQKGSKRTGALLYWQESASSYAITCLYEDSGGLIKIRRRLSDGDRNILLRKEGLVQLNDSDEIVMDGTTIQYLRVPADTLSASVDWQITKNLDAFRFEARKLLRSSALACMLILTMGCFGFYLFQIIFGTHPLLILYLVGVSWLLWQAIIVYKRNRESLDSLSTR